MFLDNKITIKLIILGDSGVGKSSIIQRYYSDSFNENLQITLKANFLEKEVIINNQKITLELWDTAGQEKYRSLTQIFVKNSKIIIFAYSVTSLKSFESLNFWYDFVQKEIRQNTILGLAGNKTDLIFENNYEEEVSEEKGKEFADKIGASFALVSAKESSKEIISLINELILNYLDNRESNSIDLNTTIRLDLNNEDLQKENCCFGNNKKLLSLKVIFLGYDGVGKTTIIKAIKGNKENKEYKSIKHTKSSYTENLYYKRNEQKILVELKDTNWKEYSNKNWEEEYLNYNLFFLVFDINKKNTLKVLEDLIKNLYKTKSKIYLLGYNNEINKRFQSLEAEEDCMEDIDLLIKNYGVEYEYINIEDIYKIKAIIIDNIRINFFRKEKQEINDK